MVFFLSNNSLGAALEFSGLYRCSKKKPNKALKCSHVGNNVVESVQTRRFLDCYMQRGLWTSFLQPEFEVYL